MVVSNFSTAYYGGKQLQYTMVVSNFSTAYYGGKQLQ